MKAVDWSDWTAPKSLPLWQCLALSLDLDPASMGVNEFLLMKSSRSKRPLLREDDPPVLRELCQRYRALAEVLDEAGERATELRQRKGKVWDWQTQLRWPRFLAWAAEQDWTLPEPLRASIAAGAKPVSKSSSAKKAGGGARGKAKKPAPASGKKAKAATTATKAGRAGKP